MPDIEDLENASCPFCDAAPHTQCLHFEADGSEREFATADGRTHQNPLKPGEFLMQATVGNDPPLSYTVAFGREDGHTDWWALPELLPDMVEPVRLALRAAGLVEMASLSHPVYTAPEIRRVP